ncbi:uncharacterized protein K489DRAFT_410846 [Dissoconium aciculare CBS 342.82]|uniref:BTB domain-containing protein n=1 Tax=Dissoconium aciculare CBS 342.82 TaxID=1314786 RepID=A0A6J3M1I5_9PEZI|nr:uncharacterized protein K489DRAFT_410846 [Dissoconium aciculare CBS 342.82]KAF1821359.1 hypothetical protein K489DRAFT_410846 [Dissoconium aciculare CBS 342.82]
MEAKQLLRSLRESPKYSDLTLVCGLQMHKVHRNVMRSASSWFDNACSNEAWKEAKEGIIKLENAFAHGE